MSGKTDSVETLVPAVSRFLQNHNIRDGQVLVGVSGGADSVALLRAFIELASSFHLRLVAGHYDHAFRPDSAEDAFWVQQLCNRFQVPAYVERRITLQQCSDTLPEEAARKLRYSFFRELSQRENCRWVAVAHTADDQVETVLFQTLRGSGLGGLAGMPAERPLGGECSAGMQLQSTIIRPLLGVSRKEVIAYLGSLAQDFRTDATNDSSTYTRNRIRNQVLPLLRKQVNPQVDEALLRISRQAADVQAMMEVLADELLQQVLLERQPGNVRLHVERLQSRPPALLRQMFLSLWTEQQWPRKDLSFAHLDRLAMLVKDGAVTRVSLPGPIEVLCRLSVLELRRVGG